MSTREISVNTEMLEGYITKMNEDSPGMSLLDYVETIVFPAQPNEPSQNTILTFKDVDFEKYCHDKNKKLDLKNAIFAGSNLNGVAFDGRYVEIEGADLRGCSTEDAIFLNGISLKDVYITPPITKERYHNATNYESIKVDESYGDFIFIAPTEIQINQYLATNKTASLNEYLTAKFSEIVEDDKIIIADLTGKQIDSKYAGADLSRSCLTTTKFTGTIENLKLRDCFGFNILFDNAVLYYPDLRGMHLGDQGQKSAINPQSTLKLIEPRLSINPDVERARGSSFPKNMKVEILDEADGIDYITRCDPCYIPYSTQQEADIIRAPHKFTQEDINAYLSYTKRMCSLNKIAEIRDFISFMKKQDPAIDPKEIYADLSGIKIESDLDHMIFLHCDLSFAIITGNIKNTKFEQCNTTNLAYYDTRNMFDILRTQYLYKYGKMESVSFISCISDNMQMYGHKIDDLSIDKSSIRNLSCENAKVGMIKISNSSAQSISFLNLNKEYENTSQKSISITNSNAANSQLSGYLAFLDISKSNFSHSNLTDSIITTLFAKHAIMMGIIAPGAEFKKADGKGTIVGFQDANRLKIEQLGENMLLVQVRNEGDSIISTLRFLGKPQIIVPNITDHIRTEALDNIDDTRANDAHKQVKNNKLNSINIKAIAGSLLFYSMTSGLGHYIAISHASSLAFILLGFSVQFFVAPMAAFVAGAFITDFVYRNLLGGDSNTWLGLLTKGREDLGITKYFAQSCGLKVDIPIEEFRQLPARDNSESPAIIQGIQAARRNLEEIKEVVGQKVQEFTMPTRSEVNASIERWQDKVRTVRSAGNNISAAEPPSHPRGVMSRAQSAISSDNTNRDAAFSRTASMPGSKT